MAATVVVMFVLAWGERRSGLALVNRPLIANASMTWLDAVRRSRTVEVARGTVIRDVPVLRFSRAKLPLMAVVSRVLAPTLVAGLEQYLGSGGGRGGAGFPTGRKWRTVVANESGAMEPPSVVVNAAEGEPGSFKDREILGRNPYQVLEGALIAAHAVGAGEVIVALKRSFAGVHERIRDAIEEVRAVGWLDGIDVGVFEGPGEYLLALRT